MKFLRFFCRLSETVLLLLALFGFFLAVCWGLGCKPFAVLSGSMEPAIHVGSLVLADRSQTEPNVGDIITFRVDRDYATHRVVRKEKDGWITKGDANDLEDGLPVRREQMCGVVRLSIPGVGYLLYSLQSRSVILFLLSYVLLTFFLDTAVSSRDNEKGEGAREHTEGIEQ